MEDIVCLGQVQNNRLVLAVSLCSESHHVTVTCTQSIIYSQISTQMRVELERSKNTASTYKYNVEQKKIYKDNFLYNIYNSC